jgi:hypothetical protein
VEIHSARHSDNNNEQQTAFITTAVTNDDAYRDTAIQSANTSNYRANDESEHEQQLSRRR